MTVELGRRFPLHAGSSSRSILAFLPATERREFLAHHELDALTPRTITDRGDLAARLEDVRATGAAQSDGERQHGAGSVASPIFGFDGQVVGAISVCGPAYRMSADVRTASRPTRARVGRPDLAGPRVARGLPVEETGMRRERPRPNVALRPAHPGPRARRSSQGRMQWSSTWRTRSRPSARTKHGRRRSRFCAICPRATTSLGAHERAGLAWVGADLAHSQAWTSTVSDCRASGPG